MWIHETPDWPNFTWDTNILAPKLANIRFQQGRLLGKMEALGFDLRKEASLSTLTQDVVKSSAIEGENLNPSEVRSSIARRLGMDIPGLVSSSRNVEGVVEMMLDATQNFKLALTANRLFDWHAALFPTGRSGMRRIVVGDWRNSENEPMQVVSGPIGHETVHYEAIAASKLKTEMDTFIAWFCANQDLDPVLKAGIAHFWFLTIHPFEDGNGRIGRAIGDMALAIADNMSDRFYSLSKQIEFEKKDYYKQLEQQQRSSSNITDWLQWFLDCLGRAITDSQITLAQVLYKAKLWDHINKIPVNARQRSIINRMLEDTFEGNMNTSKYGKLAKCSNDTALRDIVDLKARGIFIQNASGGRSTSYRLPEIERLN